MSVGALAPLDRQECLGLLRYEVVGRIATIEDGAPMIVPVNYRVLDGTAGSLIALRTRPGNLIDRTEGEVAFEIDGVDIGHRCGWSVVVRGPLLHLRSDDPRLAPLPEREAWAGDGRSAWLAIDAREITGRRLHAAAVEWAFADGAYL